MNLKIYLARHGQDEDNANGILNGRRDKALTDLGRQQATQLGEMIKALDLKFDKIYSSPLQRTYTTAQLIARNLDNILIEKTDLLIERDFGIMTGQPINKIREICSPDIIETESVIYFLNPAGAETFPQLIERSNQLLDFLYKKHKSGNILLITSGDIGKMIYATYYKLDWWEVLKMFNFKNTGLILLSENSTSALGLKVIS